VSPRDSQETRQALLCSSVLTTNPLTLLDVGTIKKSILLSQLYFCAYYQSELSFPTKNVNAGESYDVLNLHKPPTPEQKELPNQTSPTCPKAQKLPTERSGLGAGLHGQGARALPAQRGGHRTPRPWTPALPAQTCPRGRSPTPAHLNCQDKTASALLKTSTGKDFYRSNPTLWDACGKERAARGDAGAQARGATAMPLNWQGLLSSVLLPALPQASVLSRDQARQTLAFSSTRNVSNSWPGGDVEEGTADHCCFWR